MRNSPPAVPANDDQHTSSRQQWPALGVRARLIDTRLVRAELARLRGPRPGTEIYSASVVRSTISRA